MAPGSTPAMVASKKRKLSAFSMNTDIVFISVGGKQFAVHADLLHQYCECWIDKIEFGTTHDLDKESDCFCQNEPHKCSLCPPSVFRGFVYWLYRQELPSNDSIDQSEHPKEWEQGVEKEPLACSMAIELYALAGQMGCATLKSHAMRFIFVQYKNQRIVPHISRINRLFKNEAAEDEPIKRFCADIYYKLCQDDINPATQKDIEKYPNGFLARLFAIRCKCNQIALSASLYYKPQQDNLEIKLCDYVWLPEFGDKNDKAYVIR